MVKKTVDTNWLKSPARFLNIQSCVTIDHMKYFSFIVPVFEFAWWVWQASQHSDKQMYSIPLDGDRQMVRLD